MLGSPTGKPERRPGPQVIRQPREESGVGAARVHQESTTVQVQHGAPRLWASGVELAGGQAAQVPIDDPASRCGPGEKARRRTGTVEELAHPVEVVLVSTKRRLAHPTEHRVDEAQGDAALVPVHLDVAPQDGHGGHCRVGSHVASRVFCHGDPCAVDLTLATTAAQLLGELDDLRETAGCDRVSFAFQATAGVTGSRPPMLVSPLRIMSTAPPGLARPSSSSTINSAGEVASWHSSRSTSAGSMPAQSNARFATPATSSPPTPGFDAPVMVASTVIGSAPQCAAMSGVVTMTAAEPSPMGEHIGRVSGPEIVRAAMTSSRVKRVRYCAWD